LLIEPRCFVEEECADGAIEKTRDFPLEKIVGAARYLGPNQQRGKIVVTVSEGEARRRRVGGLA
jgi:hypothetical protein